MPPIAIDSTEATPSLSICDECNYRLGPFVVRCGIAILMIIFMLHILSVWDKGRSLVRGKSRGISSNEGRNYGSTKSSEEDDPRRMPTTPSYSSDFEKGKKPSR